MKKDVNLFFIIGILLVLSFSLISAWWCEDSDEGTDIFTKGVAESDAPAPYEQEVTDWCANSTLLQEAFCHSDGIIGVSGFDCPNDYVCVNGACREGCEDSDEGQNIFVKGTTTYLGYSKVDFCLEDYVQEFSCIYLDYLEVPEWSLNQEGFHCANGCIDGACVEDSYCTDSDEGKNKFVKGTVTNNGPQTSGETLTHDDFCWTNSTGQYVMEFFCSGIYQSSELILCTGGCIDGACVEASSCTDTDGGKNYYVKGEFSGMWQGQQITNTDSCVDALDETGDNVPSSNYLGEGYCENGELKVERLTCPNGCIDGACIGEKECEEGYVCLDSDKPKISIIIGGITYIVELISASDTSAMIKVNGETKEINEGYTKEVGGLNVYVKSAEETNLMLSAVLKLSKAAAEETEECSLSELEIKNCSFKDIIYTIKRKIQCEFEITYGDITEEYEILQLMEITLQNGIIVKNPNSCSTSVINLIFEERGEETECDNGCVLDDKCYPYNNRKNGYYCDVSGKWIAQVADGASCENHFECENYICASGKCIEGSLIQKILAWLRSLFS